MDARGSDYASMADTGDNDLIISSALPITLVLGALVFVVVLACGKLRKSQESEQVDDASPDKARSGHEGSANDKSDSNRAKGKKKIAPERRGRDLKSMFSHQWLLTSLKGHSGKVLDMDFSANGKYLASCAEDPPPCDGKPKTLDNSDDDSTSSGSQGSRTTGLSRRQRRNASKKKQDYNGYQIKSYQKLGLSDGQLYSLLSFYVINQKQLKECGFPVVCADVPGQAYIKASNGFPANGETMLGSGATLRKCCRCQSPFIVRDSGEYVTLDPCVHHWGKLRKLSSEDPRMVYSCCEGWKETPGCTLGKLHVSLGPTSGFFNGFVKTSSCDVIPKDNNYGVYAIDCEMCFTTQGLELVKVSLVKPDGTVIYNSLVKPANRVVDHNTRFSGITSKQLARATKSLADVQKDLLKLIHAETILIGHSLENDLRALRLAHFNIVDTSVVFPHFYGLPYRRSLKSLVSVYLKKTIQLEVHNSVEDARSCLELMLWRLKKDIPKMSSN